MNSEKIMHVRLENSEAREINRSVLLTEADVIKLHGIIKEYHDLRKKEFHKKRKMNAALKRVVGNLKKLEDLNPELEKPKILKRSHAKKVKEYKEEVHKVKQTILEKDLDDIKERLRMLDQRF